MNRLSIAMAAIICMVASASAQWSDNFDSYATGSQLHGQGGWAGWDNAASAGALVSAAQANSAPNSVAIVGASDIVRTVAGVNSGQWRLTGDVFVPGNFSGTSWFINLNTYNAGAAGAKNWSLQMQFVGSTNMVNNLGGSGNTGANITVTQRPIIRDQWVPIQVDMNFDNNTHIAYYNGQEVVSGAWALGAGSNIAFGAVDLYADTGSVVYYDNFNLSVIPEPTSLAILAGLLGGLSWLRRR